MFCSRQINQKINSVHERAIRLVYNDYETSFEELLRKDNSLLIHHRNIHKVAIEMFKVKNNISLPLMKDFFKLNESQYSTFIRPKIETERMGVSSLKNFGPIVWDTMLPKYLKDCTDLTEFKNLMKSWVPNNCKCKLCTPYIARIGYIERPF